MRNLDGVPTSILIDMLPSPDALAELDLRARSYRATRSMFVHDALMEEHGGSNDGVGQARERLNRMRDRARQSRQNYASFTAELQEILDSPFSTQADFDGMRDPEGARDFLQDLIMREVTEDELTEGQASFLRAIKSYFRTYQRRGPRTR